MNEELVERLKVKMNEVAEAMQAFATTSEQMATATNTGKPFAALMLMLKLGEQARPLADRLFEFSEVVEDMKGETNGS